jgi:hypothetical protein
LENDKNWIAIQKNLTKIIASMKALDIKVALVVFYHLLLPLSFAQSSPLTVDVANKPGDK